MRKFVHCLAGVALLVATQQASAITVFSGLDAGVGAGGATPNSDAARAAWITAIAATPTVIDFESTAAGTSVPFATGGASFSTFGSFQSVTVDTDNANTEGFNTTSGGTRHLAVWPSFDSGTTEVIVTFDNPVSAFGAYFTGLESDINGVVHLIFNDGSAQDVLVPEVAVPGSVSFVGVSSLSNPIVAVRFQEQGVGGGSRDIYGIDDIEFVSTIVPEPASMTLLTAGAGALLLRRRRAV